MKYLKNIFDFILFRLSFIIRTDLSKESVRDIFLKTFQKNKCFIQPEFDNNTFTFSHKNFMPELYNFSPIIFEGEIKNEIKTTINISVKIFPIFFWIFVLAILSILISYVTNFDNMNDDFADTPFPINPKFSPIFILIPYLYYFFKIFDVKRFIKYLMIREEKRAITKPKPNSREAAS